MQSQQQQQYYPSQQQEYRGSAEYQSQSWSYSAGQSVGGMVYRYALNWLMWLNSWLQSPMLAIFVAPMQSLIRQSWDFVVGVWDSLLLPLVGHPLFLNVTVQICSQAMRLIQQALQAILDLAVKSQQQQQQQQGSTSGVPAGFEPIYQQPETYQRK